MGFGLKTNALLSAQGEAPWASAGFRAAIAALALSCSQPQPALEPLPDLVLVGFASTVQEQLTATHARAVADPDSTSAVGQLGRELYVFGQLRSAAQCFARNRALEPNSFEWAYLLGVALADIGDSDAALGALREASSLRPRDLPTALRLADLLEQSGEPGQAREILKSASSFAPSSAAVYYRLGRLESASDLGAARAHLEKTVDLEPDYREARYALANVYRLDGRVDDAARQLDLYRDLDPTPRRHYADPLLDALNSIKTGSAQKSFNQGQELQGQGDLEGARSAYDDTLEIDPEHAQAHVNLIAIHGRMGNYEQAEIHYQQSLALNPSISEAHYNIGVTRHVAEDFAGADEAYRKALEINPQDADAHSNLGTTLEQLGSADDSLRHYRLALEHNPSHPMANFHLGKRLADQGRYRESLPYLEKAVESETMGSGLHAYLLALVYRELGQREAARSSFQHALQAARARGQSDLATRIEAELGP